MILSTKKLSPAQKNIFLKSGLDVFDYDAIKVELLDFRAPTKIDNAIFSSQNAVRSFFSRHNLSESSLNNVFCIGDKTHALLEENGQKVFKKHQKASDLAIFLQKTTKNEDFYFFCGNLRRDEIPLGLNSSKNQVFEVKTYKTELKSMKIDENWEKILFFSPSGVRSFSQANIIANASRKLINKTAICIGETTASEAKKYFNKIEISAVSTIESVIKKAAATR